jgi:hypothetical protein
MQHHYLEDISAFNSALKDDRLTAVSERRDRHEATSKRIGVREPVPLTPQKRLELAIVASLAGATWGFGAFSEEY